MDKPYPALCMDCEHAQPEEKANWNNRCFHQDVIACDSWALANNDQGKPYGVTCREQRQKRSPFAPCGMKGKLWTPKKDKTG